MSNLIQQIQAQHDTDKPYVVSMSSKDVQMHKDRGHLLAVIKAVGALAYKWRDEDEIMSHGGRLLTALDCVEDIEALLNGNPK